MPKSLESSNMKSKIQGYKNTKKTKHNIKLSFPAYHELYNFSDFNDLVSNQTINSVNL